jgi:TolB protein
MSAARGVPDDTVELSSPACGGGKRHSVAPYASEEVPPQCQAAPRDRLPLPIAKTPAKRDRMMTDRFRKGLRLLATAAALALMPVLSPAHAEITVDITQGNMEPLPIAITDFRASGGDPQMAADIAGIIRNNLSRSGLFRALDPASFIDRGVPAGAEPNFTNWRPINAKALVAGDVYMEPDGRLRVEFRLWDVLASEQLEGLRFYTTPENWRRVGHLVSDAIYKRLTGEDGYFDTRIAFIAESGPVTQRSRRLAIMDQDGANVQYLTGGEAQAVTPRFNPASPSMISFMSYAGDVPRVILFDLQTGGQETLSGFPGQTFSPRFSPDGSSIVMSMARDGNTDIYLMDLRSRSIRRLTNDPGIDTSPSFSPDGSRIAFESDRGGTQQIYVMGADGSGQNRVSFGSGRYATPAWSPRGDLIAFTKIAGGRFGIGVMRTDGSGERTLTSSFLDEGPTWAPNGRVIMFTRGSPGGRSRLYSVDLTGSNERAIPTPGDASDPSWSPPNR